MSKLLEIKASPINQLVNKEIFISKMNIEELKGIIKYTNRKSNETYDSENTTNVEEQYLYYQRLKNSDRSYQIKLFFLKHIYNKYNFEKLRVSPLGTFPSSIILALSSFEGLDENEYTQYLDIDEKPESIFVDRVKEKILIPKQNQALIVDGQHRIAGLELLLDEAEKGQIVFRKANQKDNYALHDALPFSYIIEEVKNFSFIISLLIDFDLYEQSEIFATVNFNQQRVNKSFYYDIFGASNNGKTIEKLLHDIASHMNFKDDSPLFHKIKMLGSGQGYFSQAFFVDAFIPHFKSGVFQFVYSDFQKGGELYKKIPPFLKAYFSSIFEVFGTFLPGNEPGTYKNNLVKTTGMGALIMLLPIVFNDIKNTRQLSKSSDVLEIPQLDLKNRIKEIFNEIENKGNLFFGETGNFSKGSGKGLQNKLFNDINIAIGLNIKQEKPIEPLI